MPPDAVLREVRAWFRKAESDLRNPLVAAESAERIVESDSKEFSGDTPAGGGTER